MPDSMWIIAFIIVPLFIIVATLIIVAISDRTVRKHRESDRHSMKHPKLYVRDE